MENQELEAAFNAFLEAKELKEARERAFELGLIIHEMDLTREAVSDILGLFATLKRDVSDPRILEIAGGILESKPYFDLVNYGLNLNRSVVGFQMNILNGGFEKLTDVEAASLFSLVRNFACVRIEDVEGFSCFSEIEYWFRGSDELDKLTVYAIVCLCEKRMKATMGQ